MIKSSSATILSLGAHLSGELDADEEIILGGTFEGTLRTTRLLHVANTGTLQGAVFAESVLVLGCVDGPIHASDRIELQPGARVTGDIEAQHVRIHDEVVFNGHCRITGTETLRRQYLVPALVQAFGAPASGEALENVARATEGFLRDFGFEVEVRSERPSGGAQVLRPIFRSRDALPYGHLREQLRHVEEALQTTGADASRQLMEAMRQLRSGALLVGPVIVTQLESDRGPRVTVRVRQDSLPPETVAAAGAPDPSSLLLSLQKVQAEVVNDLSNSMAVRATRT